MAHLVVNGLREYVVPGHPLYGFHGFFRMGGEGNLPAYFSGLCLLASGILLMIIGLAKRRATGVFHRHWVVLGAGFLFMSVDEVAGIHDRLVSATLQSHFGAGEGVLYRIWVIPAIVLVAIVLASYVPFLLHLPRRYAGLFILAGILFVGGAVGMEMVEGYILSAGGGGFAVHVARMVEETCELAGIAVFVYALLRYMGERGHGLVLQVGPPGSS